jgi:uncharacterized LabA/DUF88 family protein
MPRVRAYIDGFNLYHAIDRIGNPLLKWVDHYRLVRSLLKTGETLESVHFFTAVWRFDRAKQQRHVNFLKACRAVGIDVHEGNFKKGDKYCHDFGRYCRFREEKQTDVAIAVKVISDVLTKAVDRIILFTADTDQIPTVDYARQCGVAVSLVFPPGRGSEARDLAARANESRELSAEHISAYPLPRSVLDPVTGDTVATMPTVYLGEP